MYRLSTIPEEDELSSHHRHPSTSTFRTTSLHLPSQQFPPHLPPRPTPPTPIHTQFTTTTQHEPHSPPDPLTSTPTKSLTSTFPSLIQINKPLPPLPHLDSPLHVLHFGVGSTSAAHLPLEGALGVMMLPTPTSGSMESFELEERDRDRDVERGGQEPEGDREEGIGGAEGCGELRGGGEGEMGRGKWVAHRRGRGAVWGIESWKAVTIGLVSFGACCGVALLVGYLICRGRGECV